MWLLNEISYSDISKLAITSLILNIRDSTHQMLNYLKNVSIIAKDEIDNETFGKKDHVCEMSLTLVLINSRLLYNSLEYSQSKKYIHLFQSFLAKIYFLRIFLYFLIGCTVLYIYLFLLQFYSSQKSPQMFRKIVVHKKYHQLVYLQLEYQ